ncbi:type I-E CRISPR-associated protein Cse1/CasA [Thermodesulfobacteriota bacterium]
MNLVEEAWIPVVKTDGEKTKAGLCDIFLSGTAYPDLSVRAHERVALMRLLICIAQAAINGPENLCQWEKTPDLLPAKADEYLTKWQDSLNLFHPEKPFLQIAGLELSGSSPACKMDFAMATGNNTTLFDHRGNDDESRPLSEGQLAVNLVTFQNFSPGGLSSTVVWKNRETKKYGVRGGPCVKGSMYHTFLKGANFAETIHLNLLTKKAVELVFGNEGWGKPVWEMMPSGADDGPAIANATETYLGRLVPLSRWIKLQDQSWMLWGDGFTYPVFPDFRCPEPSATSIEQKDNQGNPVRNLLKANHARGIWRQLAALVVKRRADSVGGALALDNVPDNSDFDIHVCALLRKQATIEAYQESVLNIPAGMNTDVGRAAYEEEVKAAEVKAHRLEWAVVKWRQEMDKDFADKLKEAHDKKQEKTQKRLISIASTIATNHFWTAVEKNVPSLVAYTSSLGENDNEERKKIWRRAVHRAAREAYELACGRESPRQLRAFAMGLRTLEREELPETKNKEE